MSRARLLMATGRHFTSGERVAWSANTVVDGTGMIGVPGPLPSTRMVVTIRVGDGPYVHGHTRVP
ncbi:MAG TPA: hypothetical protein VMF14_03535 [Solirubrobacteraceae bacterium]|nr:hypothetical protein [Solirubrobacteraceae bacterium]